MQHAVTNVHNKSQPPQEGCLAWEASEYVSHSIGQHSQSLPHLMRILKDMQKTLDKTRVAYNQALQERDDERAKLQDAENRLGSVQRVVQRYAGVAEPVVASDGYTYERNVIQQYLSECKSTETNAYSQQTKEVLSNNLVPNESLKKLVDLLRQVRPTDITPASKATTIPPYRSNNNVNFLEEEESKKKAVHASDLEAGFKHDGAHAAASAKREEQPKKDREERPFGGSAHASAAGKGAKGQPALHPCLRVYGFCNFKDDCSFAKYPYDACLNYIKGKCRFGDGCKELHVNLKESRYTNANARVNGHADPHAAVPKKAEAATKDEGKKEEKKDTNKPATKEAAAPKTSKK